MSLPRATSTYDGTEPACPWCQGQMAESTVRLGALNAAWQDHETDWPRRSDAGAAECELIAECPGCLRPSMVALGSREDRIDYGQVSIRRYVRLVPVHTDVVAEWLSKGGSAQ